MMHILQMCTVGMHFARKLMSKLNSEMLYITFQSFSPDIRIKIFLGKITGV